MGKGQSSGVLGAFGSQEQPRGGSVQKMSQKNWAGEPQSSGPSGAFGSHTQFVGGS